MPPSKDPNGPPEPHNNIDLGKILLPKKETPAGTQPGVAQRINAGALLEQEQQAATDGLPGPAAEAPQPPVPLVPKEEPLEVSSLQTYKGDVERAVETKGVSVVSVAAAEADRRGKQGGVPQPAQQSGGLFGLSFAMVGAGVALIMLAIAVVAFVLLRPGSVPAPATPIAPFISVDDMAVVPADLSSRTALVSAITAAVQSASLSLGLIEWLYLAVPGSDSAPEQITAPQLLETLSSELPADLARTLQPEYLLGVHSFDENQAFLLLQTDSYGAAYSGMLAWERTLRGDLNPIFNRTPSPRIITETAASSTAASSTEPFFNLGFVDRVVENRDTRVLLNEQGDILLLWTMLGRTIVLITTNEYTLREVVSRMNVAPIVPIPGR